MIRRLSDIAKGLAALCGILVLLVATPYLLWRFGGVPAVGIVDTLGDRLASDDSRTEQLLAGVLLLIAWACWAQVAYALSIETVAAVQGRAARRAPILPGIQAAVSRLVATATLTVTSLTPPAAVLAVPLVPVELSHASLDPIIETVGARTTSEPAAPQDGSTRALTYVVGERDTFWSIAEDTLGDGLRWQEVRDVNIGSVMIDGTTISSATEATRPGWNIELPADAVPAVTLTSEPTESSTPSDEQITTAVEVEEGDHFWSLAEEAISADWGRAPSNLEIGPYWAEVVALNEDRLLPPGDPNLIYPGQRFELPTVPADPMARQQTEQAPTTPVIEAPPLPDQALTPPPVPATAPATPTPSVAEVEEPKSDVAAASPMRAEEAQDADAGGEASDNATLLVAAGIGTAAVSAGAIALTLRRRRHHQAARRLPETTIEPPSPEANAYERRLRPVADTEAARWVEATNKLITHRLSQHPESRIPAVIAMRAGRFGVEILLDEPCAPIEGFVPGNEDNGAWRVHPDLELRMIESETDGTQPYSPALVCVGTTEAGDLLLDLEQLSAISISGDEELVTGWFRSIAVGVAANPWSQYCEVVVIGLPDDFDALDRVVSPADPTEWCEQSEQAIRKLHERLGASPYEQRINPGEIFHPTIVLLGSDDDEIARKLADAATLVNAPLVVLAATPLPQAERIHLNATLSTLEPAGVHFTPIITDEPEAEVINELLDNATSTETAPTDATPEPTVEKEPHAAELEPVEELIARITAPRPVEVKILTAMPTVTGLSPEPATKQLSVISYLAYHRSVSSSRLRETFWPSATNRSTPDNAISQIRGLLGSDAEGESRLAQAINSGQYDLSSDVGCDWTRAQELINEAGARPDAESVDLLRAALGVVDGHAGRDAPPRQFAWLCDDHAIYSTIETTLIDAAHQLGELALERGDHELAAWAADKGHAVVPGNEAMFRLRMRAAAAAGDSKGVKAAYDHAQRAATEIGPWVDVDTETDDLFNGLTGEGETRAS